MSIKKKYCERRINRQKQWPPCHAQKLVRLELVEGKKEGYSYNQKGCRDKAMKQTLLAYSDIFKVESGRQPVRIVLLEGDAGIGKSSLCVSVCEEWANDRLFQEFELVLLLPLRERKVALAGSLTELLTLLHSSKEVCTSVASYLEEEEGENVLIIADGWDELGESDCRKGSFLEMFLLGDLFPFVTLLLTSRPSASASLHRHPRIDRFVKIFGFNQESINEYIQLEFAGDQEKALSLLDHLKDNVLVQKMCSIPLNCAIICHLWRTHEEALPSTMTGIYTEIILNFILRSMQKCEEYKSVVSLPRFSDLPKDLQRPWMLLCKFAYRAMEIDDFVFSQVLPHDPDGALDRKIQCFGLLHFVETMLEVGVGVTSYFVYLIFQEYLAALYIVNQPPETQLELCQKHCKSPQFTMVWKFFFGLCFRRLQNNGTDRAVVHPFNRTVVKEILCSRSADGCFLCHCAFEANDDAISMEVAKLLYNFSAVHPSTAHDCVAVIHVISNLQESKVVNLNFRACGLSHKLVASLASTLASKQGKLQVEKLNLGGNNLDDVSIFRLFQKAAAAFQTLSNLYLNENFITAESFRLVFLPSSYIKILDMSHTQLGSSGLQLVIDAVCASQLCNLESLCLKGSLSNDLDVNGAQLATLTKALSTSCCIKRLDLSGNNLGIPGAVALGNGISKLVSSEDVCFSLFLNETMLGNEGVDAFSQKLGMCKINTLQLQNNNIHAAGISALVDCITSGKLILTHLGLSDNPLGSEAVVSIWEMLKSDHCQLEVLELSRCLLGQRSTNIQDGFAGVIFRNNDFQTSQNGTLRILSLNGNQFSEDSTLILAGFMFLCQQLKWLLSTHCGITSYDLKYLISLALNKISPCSLKSWQLTGNAIDDSGVIDLIEHLQLLFPKALLVVLDDNPVHDTMKETLTSEIVKLRSIQDMEV